MPPCALAVFDDASPSLVASSTRAPASAAPERGLQPGAAGADHEHVAALLGHADRLVACALWTCGGTRPSGRAPAPGRGLRRCGPGGSCSFTGSPGMRANGTRPRPGSRARTASSRSKHAGTGAASGSRPTSRPRRSSSTPRSGSSGSSSRPPWGRPVARRPDRAPARCSPARHSCAVSSLPRQHRHGIPAAPRSCGGWFATWPLPFPSQEEALAFFGGDTLLGRTFGRASWSGATTRTLARVRLRCPARCPHARRTSASHWDAWAGIRCPALVVRAAAGVSPQEVRRMAELLPGTRPRRDRGCRPRPAPGSACPLA